MKFDTAKIVRLLDANDRIEIAKRRFSAALRRVAPIGAKVMVDLWLSAEKRFDLVPGTVSRYCEPDVGQLVVEVAPEVAALVADWAKVRGHPNEVVVSFSSLKFPVE